MSKLPKFEIELPAAPKSTKLNLSERDIAMATMYVYLLTDFLLQLFLVIQVVEAHCKYSRAALSLGSLGPHNEDFPFLFNM